MASLQQLPMNLQIEQDAIARRRQLAEAMLAQAGQARQGQMISGHFVAPGWADVLGRVASAYMGQKLQNQAGEDQAAFGDKYNKQLADSISQYMSARDGKPGEVMSSGQAASLMQDNVAPQLAEPVRGDPRKAAIGALTSGFAPLQQLGQTELAQMLKPQKAPDPLAFLKLTGFDPKSRVAAALGGGASALQPEAKEHVVDGKIVRGASDGSGAYTIAGDFGAKWSEPYPLKGADGKADIVIRNLGTGEIKKIDNAPKVQVQSHVSVNNKGEGEFMKVLGEGRAKIFIEAEKGATTANNILDAVKQMEELDSKGVFSGATANVATTLSNISQVLGMPVDAGKLANSEAYQQQFAKQIGSYLADSSVGRSLTDKDRELLEKTMPSLLQSPDGRKLVYSKLREGAAKAMSHHQSLQRTLSAAYPEHKGMLGVSTITDKAGPGVPTPMEAVVPGNKTRGTNAAPMSFDEWLRAQSQGK